MQAWNIGRILFEGRKVDRQLPNLIPRQIFQLYDRDGRLLGMLKLRATS